MNDGWVRESRVGKWGLSPISPGANAATLVYPDLIESFAVYDMPHSQRDLSQRDLPAVTAHLAATLPALQAVYLFGSQATGEATQESDVDLALLLAAPLPPEQRWQLSGDLADRLGKEVDLIDLRRASTVFQHQVVTTGERLWHRGSDSDEFELTVQSEYWDLAIQRRALIADIKQRGSVHGR